MTYNRLQSRPKTGGYIEYGTMSSQLAMIRAILVSFHRYFVLLRYTAVYRDLGDTGIVA